MSNNNQEFLNIVSDYIDKGLSLVRIQKSTKSPNYKGWSLKSGAIRKEDVNLCDGVGLAHAYSGTMALDIDDYAASVMMLKDVGVNLPSLCSDVDAVGIVSGRAGRCKLLYRMPFGIPLPTKKILQGTNTIYELRCATVDGLTVQDVLPPSIHPDTGHPYQWVGGGHYSKIPIIPDSLLRHWASLIECEKERSIPTGTTLDASWSEIKHALDIIPPGCSREEWIAVGMALHWAASHGGNPHEGFVLWNEWSRESKEKYPSAQEMSTQWGSFRQDKGNPIKVGTLFHIASKYGWTRPIPDVSALFSGVVPEGVPEVDQHPTKGENQTSEVVAEADAVIFNSHSEVDQHSTQGENQTSEVVAEADAVIFDSTPTPPDAVKIDVLDAVRMTPPDINLELWPEILRKRAEEVSEGIGCDAVIPLLAGLSAMCGAVDARTRLELLDGFCVPPVLWIMTIGEPADKKSPASKPMLSPLRIFEEEDRKRYSKDILDWEGLEAAHASTKKNFIEWASSVEKLMGDDQAPVVTELPPRPVPVKITTSDITSQKLIRIAAERPRGLLCHLDEMNSWVKKMTDKSSGDDRSSWVVSYESDVYEMDRVGAGTIRCENLAVSIYGNMQPNVLKVNFKALAADGLLQRFIPAVIRAGATRRGNPVPIEQTCHSQYVDTLRLIYALPPTTYKLSTEARAAFREFQSWYEMKKRDERLLSSGDEYMTAFGKIEGLVGRLTLMFHLAEAPFSPTVPVETLNRVINVACKYIIPAYRHTLCEVAGSDADPLFQSLKELIILEAGSQEPLTIKAIRTRLTRTINSLTPWQRDNRIIDIMELFEVSRWVIRIDDDPAAKKITWAINPSLATAFKDYRNAVVDARQRMIDHNFKSQEAKRHSKYQTT